MKTLSIVCLFVLAAMAAQAQSRFSTHEFSINGFRNPSIGAEYRYRYISVHAGYYPTNFETNTTTEFIRTGVTLWFLPIGKRENPSSFYTSLSFARGRTREYEDKNAVMPEIGFRWMIYKGLNFRIGVTGLAAKGQSFKINPTPGISYSFFFR
jgi:hypothetical protein